MSGPLLPLSSVASKLDAWAATAILARDRANDADTIAKMDNLVRQYQQLSASVQSALAPRHAARILAGPTRSRLVRIAMTAEMFWDAVGAAQRAIKAVYGDRWAIVAPIGETVLATVPAQMRNFHGARGSLIRNRPDHRLPAAKYWPGGELPTGLDLTEDYARCSVEAYRVAHHAPTARHTWKENPLPNRRGTTMLRIVDQQEAS